MRLIKHSLSVLAICLCSVGYAGSKAVEPRRQINAGATQELSEMVASIATLLETIGTEFDYKWMRCYVTGDEWDGEGQGKLLIDRAYYSLLIIDEENPHRYGPFHANAKGHINVVVLVFKNADLAAREVARLKEETLDQFDTEVVKSDENGFQIKGKRISYVAVVHGAKVVLLQENENLRIKNLTTIAERLEKDAW
jgi:hypothetical protein